MSQSLETTSANQHYFMLHGKKEFVFADAGYQGAKCREELADMKVELAIVI
ncbi:hypothetical protein NUK55_07340 [Aeromonas veronii]|uniref:hypothetical protein n=1 Tax=Aeromonas veronii TaxID=654 RepID=UPI00214D2BCE|nr:hypothetical protein [Aeromonas veronii]MCR3970917.1 hypothetical protein [Aeromonas veronii]MCR3975245.1 hypothetical protein [Aeromonas veronii]